MYYCDSCESWTEVDEYGRCVICDKMLKHRKHKDDKDNEILGNINDEWDMEEIEGGE